MEIQELPGVGPVLASRLAAAGYGSIAAIAGADPASLGAVPGLGPTTSRRLIEAAGATTSAASGASHPTSRVATAIDRLRAAIPDLARSKKHAAALVASTNRMTTWLAGLDRRKVRKRLIAETRRISSEAKKRASSNRSAKALRGHAERIEKAVRRLDA
jgi:hypothetical protein